MENLFELLIYAFCRELWNNLKRLMVFELKTFHLLKSIGTLMKKKFRQLHKKNLIPASSKKMMEISIQRSHSQACRPKRRIFDRVEIVSPRFCPGFIFVFIQIRNVSEIQAVKKISHS